MRRKIIVFSLFILLITNVKGIEKYNFNSMILPGWGEYVIGEKNRANYFFTMEATLWLFYFINKKREVSSRNNYIAFSELHADVDMDNKSYLFAVNLGHYNSLEEYNDIKERQRLPQQKYSSPEFNWEWDSDSKRLKYDQMRINSVNAQKYAKFAVGGLILNRLISFIDVIYLERKKSSLSIKTNLFHDKQNINLKITFAF